MPLLMSEPAVVDRGLEATKLSAHGAFDTAAPYTFNRLPGK
jgi:hypothetical protein